MQPRRHDPNDPALSEILALIRRSFAYMDGRIDPPSSMLRLDLEQVAAQCRTGEVWSIGTPVRACMFLTLRPSALYLGKLAVDTAYRGRGFARRLVDLAADRAKTGGFDFIELQTRIELTENHEAFARLGFVKTGDSRHPGYDRATSITMRRAVW